MILNMFQSQNMAFGKMTHLDAIESLPDVGKLAHVGPIWDHSVLPFGYAPVAAVCRFKILHKQPALVTNFKNH
jgi:hypothetical protein